MSNEWNGNPRIWETSQPPAPAYAAESSGSNNFYGAGGAPSHYYNAPAQQAPYNQHYSAAPASAQGYQHPSQMVTGYSFNPPIPASTNTLQDASMVLNTVNKLNQSLGGLDIDPELLNALSKHIKNDNATDQAPRRVEIYSPTFNSPSPSPERKPSDDKLIEVDGKKLVTSRPFYEQFNHYEDETDNMTSKVDQFLTRSRRSRSSERRGYTSQDRTWEGSVSPPSHRQEFRGQSPFHHRSQTAHSSSITSRRRSRSPLAHRSRSSRRDDKCSSRGGRSRSPRRSSPRRRTRSKSRESVKYAEIKEKVINLLAMSKSENRKFASAQQLSSVLLVMNLDSWITDKVLWGAIHKYAREYGTKPPFYIEKASFHFSQALGETFLALIAFATVSAAEMCMMHTKCELEITGRQKKSFKMMYYNENTIVFDALNHKFTGIWRAVLKKRAELLEGSDDDSQNNEELEKRRDYKIEDKPSRSHKSESDLDKKIKNIKKEDSYDSSRHLKTELDESADINRTSENTPKIENMESVSTSVLDEETKSQNKNKPQANIIKTNVLIGKMKSYLIKQNKPKPDEDNIKTKNSESSSDNQNKKDEREKSASKISVKEPVSKPPKKDSAYEDSKSKSQSQRREEKSVVDKKQRVHQDNVKVKPHSQSMGENKIAKKIEEKAERTHKTAGQKIDPKKEVHTDSKSSVTEPTIKKESELKENRLKNDQGKVKADNSRVNQPNTKGQSIGISESSNSDKKVETGKSNERRESNEKPKPINSRANEPSGRRQSAEASGTNKNKNEGNNGDQKAKADKSKSLENQTVEKKNSKESVINASSSEKIANNQTLKTETHEGKTNKPAKVEQPSKEDTSKIVPLKKVDVSKDGNKKEVKEKIETKVSTDKSTALTVKSENKTLETGKSQKSTTKSAKVLDTKCINDGKEELGKNLPPKKTSAELNLEMNKKSKDAQNDAKTSKDVESDAKSSKNVESDSQTTKVIESDAKTSKDVENDGKTSTDVESDAKISKDLERNAKTSKILESDSTTSENVENDAKTTRDVETDAKTATDVESGAKTSYKRQMSPNRRNPKKARGRRSDVDELFSPHGEDIAIALQQEEEEAELFGKRPDKFRRKRDRFNRNQSLEPNHKGGRNFDREDNSPFHHGRGNSREDRFGKDDRWRGGFRNDNRRSNWEHPGHHDKRRRGDQDGFDDIDGNEDGYWNRKRESPKQPPAVNPWIHNEAPSERVSLSLKELKDPEFLLRVLLQTSIMIQNNQLTMANPLDSLTPTDKDLIIQTLNEIEATSQVVIYATLNDKTKFNAAEHRVLLEALSNIHMFKAALLPPGSFNASEDMDIDKNEDYTSGPSTESKKEQTDVYVSMNNIKQWVTKNHVIKYLRDFNLRFDYVKIHPILRNETYTDGFIKFTDLESASELLKRTNRVLYVGRDKDGIQLSIADVSKKPSKWTCNSCSMRNSYDTLICLKCQKLKEKLRDIQITTDVTNKIALINFKKTTTVDDIQQIFKKIAPFLSATVKAHIDSSSDLVVHFLVELPNPQACSMLKKCIRDHMEEFSHIRAGPRVAMSFLVPHTPVSEDCAPKQRMYTFADVPRLAQYSASLYATTEVERVKFFEHYTALYTQELIQGNPINVVLPEDVSTPQSSGVPNGTDDKRWPVPNVSSFTYDQNSGYYYDHSTGLYYESSSQYFYNMETGKFLQYDNTRGTYVLVQNSEISSAPVKAGPGTASGNITNPSAVSQDDQNALRTSSANKESKIHAKKVMKDLEKWSKSVKKQKKAIANVFDQDTDSNEKSTPADVGFDILRKTEPPKPGTSKPGTSSVQSISSLIMDNHTLCEDEEEEYAFIDWKNFTCNLCHRVFNNADVLNKHSKLSELHRNNLKQWYVSKNLDPDDEENRKQQYRDRAAERRNKTMGKTNAQNQGRGGASSPAESWLCSTPGCMAYKRSGFDSCITCEKNMDSRYRSNIAPPVAPVVPDMSVGSRLLMKMGWDQGTGLGKAGQGNKNPVQVEKKSGYLGLGAQKEEMREEGESYTSFIKRSTQRRFQQVSDRY
ncbi:hypothetical protein M8J76_007958 [Diaphorina citri]|nr:hypothetical protein M8J75_015804 [Diaphorina citri]KAI5736871.1 hypothetical protein M8J76_007958 [Diaphorina citri]KAI5742526.1 hypothetical protein M8J77_008246 [Diaphorina citri]